MDGTIMVETRGNGPETAGMALEKTLETCDFSQKPARGRAEAIP
jgi:hypothetical protein